MAQLTLTPKNKPFDYKPSTKKDKDFLEYLNRCIGEASIFCEPEHRRVEENSKYERGFQWSEGDAARQKDKDRPALPLNDISKGLSSVANREIMDRYTPKVFGREPDDDGKAELLDELSRWQRDAAETEHEESRAFRQACGSGYGVMHKYWNEVEAGGEGMVMDEEVPIWTMLWDPRARKQNLVDRKYHISGKYVPVSEIIDQFGQRRGLKKRLSALSGKGGSANGSAPGGSAVALAGDGVTSLQANGLSAQSRSCSLWSLSGLRTSLCGRWLCHSAGTSGSRSRMILMASCSMATRMSRETYSL